MRREKQRNLAKYLFFTKTELTPSIAYIVFPFTTTNTQYVQKEQMTKNSSQL